MPTITPLDFEKEIREFRGQQQALKLPPINQSNGFENFFKREDKLHKNLKLLDITTTSKRRKLSRQKIKKKAKNVEEEFSSKVKKVKKSEKAPSAQRIYKVVLCYFKSQWFKVHSYSKTIISREC